MNKFDLFEAMGGIDEELLKQSEYRAPRKLPVRKLLFAAAAVMLLAVTVFAAPKLMDLFFGGELTQLTRGIYYVSDTVSFYRDAEYQVDMTYPCAETAPVTIEEYRLPSFFEENGWTCDFSLVDLGCDWINPLYLFSEPENPAYWVQFRQAPFTMDETRGRYQFLMNAGLTGLVTEQEVTIGEFSGTMYVIEPSEEHGDTGQKNLVWSDGEYAYLLECGYTVPDETIAEIVLSLAPVENISIYGGYHEQKVDIAYRLSIDTFYTLSDLPKGFKLEERSWDVNMAHQYWISSGPTNIYLSQECLISDENHGPALDILGTLADVMTSLKPYEYDAVEENGLLYHIVRHQGDTFAMWENDNYVFMLRFNCQTLSTDQMLEHLRNIVPMDDFTDQLTD